MRAESYRTPIVPVLLAFVLASSAFVASILVSQVAAGGIHASVEDITLNSVPSVIHLVSAENALWQVNLEVERYYEAIARGRTERISLPPALNRMETEWRLYAATPQFPGEHELLQKTAPRLAGLGALVRHLAADSARPDPLPPELSDREAAEVFHDAATSLLELVELNERGGHQAVMEIDRRYWKSVWLALSLGAGALILTVLLASRTVRTLRKLDRIQREHERLLQERAEEASLFASYVAHDVRGPIAAAVLWCDVAKQPGQNVAVAVAKVRESLTCIAQVVNHLYDFARAIAPAQGEARTELARAVQAAVGDVRLSAQTAQMTVAVGEMLECIVAAAPGVVASILANLLGNAVKYAGAGSHVEVRSAQTPAGWVRVEVADTGVGMTPEALAVAFQPYRRGATRGEGMGLGLATVKRLVEQYGGTCGAESGEGRGCVFWFELLLLERVSARWPGLGHGTPHAGVA